MLRDVYIHCVFSFPIDTSTVRQNFSITPQVNGNIVYSHFYVSGDMFYFYPISNFASNTTYTVTISTGLRSRAGEYLTIPYVFSFTTGN